MNLQGHLLKKGLTVAQTDLAGLIAVGASDAAIADAMNCSEEEVRRETETLFALLEVTSKGQFLSYCAPFVRAPESRQSRHTPGPWKFLDWDDDYISVTDVEQMYGICRLHSDYSESKAAQLANARLIAAAPELLEALKVVTGILERRDFENARERHNCVAFMAKAIAKAEGRGE